MRALTSGVRAYKTTGVAAWDQQVYSQQSFLNGAYAAARAAVHHAMFGLNGDPTTNADYATIDFAWYTNVGNDLRIFESGVDRGSFGVWAVGDLLEIIYDAANIKYYKNGALIRTVAVGGGGVYFFDSSFYGTGELNDIRFGPSAGLVPITYVASAGMAMTAGEFATITGAAVAIHVQSESQDADGTWQSHNTLQGRDWTTAFKYRGDGDSAIVSGVIELARADRTLSMAPLVTGSLINRNAAAAYAPFLDGGRRVRVRTAILPQGVAPYLGVGGVWSSSGVVVSGAIAAVNNGDLVTQSFHTDTAVAGAYAQVDMGAPVEFDQIRVWLTSQPGAQQWKIQGSPDAATWTDIRSGFATSKKGDNIFHFPRSRYRYWRLTLTNTPGAGPYVSEIQFNRDWREVFDGYIDKVGIGGRDDNAIVIECRDLGALLIDTDIEVVRQYGSGAGIAVETVMQSILDDNLGAGVVTLYTPISPNWNIHEFSQKLQSTMEGLRALAKQIGYEVRYLYDANNVARLTFYAPDRAKTISDYAIGPTVYWDITRLDVDMADVRNAWTVEYIDRATGNKLTAIATSAPSIAQFRRRPAKIAYGFSSNIDSAVEAQKMVDAAVADTAFPKATEVADLQYFPLVDLADFVTMLSNGEHYDTDQQRAVLAYEHDLRDGTGNTTLTMRGKPGGGYDTWMSMVGGMLDGPSLVARDIPGATPAANHQVTYTGSWDTIQLSIDGAAWIVPGASPLTVTPNAAGGAAKQYTFRAIKNGQIVTQTVYVDTPPPLPPQAVISFRDLETDDNNWFLRFNAVVGSGGGGANLTWVLKKKIGFGANTTLASGNATALPNDQTVARHPRSDTTLTLDVTDVVTGLTDSKAVVVPSARPELNNTGNPYRNRPFDDGDYPTRSPHTTGLSVHPSTVDSRSALINAMHRTSVDTADNVLDGGSRRAIPYSILRASDSALMSRVDYGATIGDSRAHVLTKQSGTYFQEVFDVLPATQGYFSVVGTQTLVNTAGVAAMGTNVLNVVGYTGFMALPYNLPFNPSKLYRIKVRYRQTVNDSRDASHQAVYIGLQGLDSAANPTNINGGYNYVAVAGDTPTVAQGWKEVTTFVKGAISPASASSAGASTDARSPSDLRVNTVQVKPHIALNYPDGNGTAQLDYYVIEELDEDASNRTYQTVSVGGNIYRSRPTDDGLYTVRGDELHGWSTHSSVMDARSYPLNAHYNTGVHTLSDTVDGASRFASPVVNATSDITLLATGAVTVAGNSANATGAAAWNAQVYSKMGYFNGAHAETTVVAGAGPTMFGLNVDPTLDSSYASIDYAFYITASAASLQIYESGAAIGSFGTYNTGDVLAVTYDGALIKYTQNGGVIRAVYVGAGLSFYFDSSFHANGRLGNIKFTPQSPSVLNFSSQVIRGIQWNDARYSLQSFSSDGRIVETNNPYLQNTVNYLSNAYQFGSHTLDNVSDGGTYGRVAGVNASHLATPTSTIGRGSIKGYKINSQTLTTGTLTQLAIDNAEFAVGTGITRSGNHFIVNDAVASYGVWVFIAQVGFAATSAAGDRYVEIQKNSAKIGATCVRATANSTNPTLIPVLAFVSGLAINDDFVVYVKQDSGGNLAIRVPADETFFVAVHLW